MMLYCIVEYSNNRVARHVAADDADPSDAHDEGDNVVVLEQRPRAVRHCEAYGDGERQAEDEQEAFGVSLRPLEAILLSQEKQNKRGRDDRCVGQQATGVAVQLMAESRLCSLKRRRKMAISLMIDEMETLQYQAR